MPKKGARRPKPIVGDPNDPEGLYVWMKRFLEPGGSAPEPELLTG